MGIEGGGEMPSIPEGVTSPDVCASFKTMPSCGYLPAEVRGMCEKCKGQ